VLIAAGLFARAEKSSVLSGVTATER
jgi:hypothetical protein